MVLAAERNFTVEFERRILQREVDISTRDMVCLGMKTIRHDCLFDCENRWKRFVLDNDLLGGSATKLLRFANDERYDLSAIEHFLVGEQNFVVTHRADVI